MTAPSISFTLGTFVTPSPHPLDTRPYPVKSPHAYPAPAERNLFSLVLQSVAGVNEGDRDAVEGETALRHS